MSDPFSLAALDGVEQLPARLRLAQERLQLIFESQTVTAPFDALLRIRCLGSGGPGQGSPYNKHGKGGTVGLKTARIKRGQSLVCTIGSNGGTTVITGPGVSINIPGAANEDGTTGAPTGLDWFAIAADETPLLHWGKKPPVSLLFRVPAEETGAQHGAPYLPPEASVLHLATPFGLRIPGYGGGAVAPIGGSTSASGGTVYGAGAGGRGQSAPGLVVLQWLEVL